MKNGPQLHSSIVSMISLAAGIAAKHPSMALCQLSRLREMGIPEHQLQTVIELARHIRDEAAEKLDVAFDAEAGSAAVSEKTAVPDQVSSACCGTTRSGQSCC